MIDISGNAGDTLALLDLPSVPELAREMKRLSMLMRNPLALARTWSGGKVEFLYVCEQFARWHGTTPEAILRDAAETHAAIAPEDRADFMRTIGDCLNSDSACHKQFRLRPMGGADRWVLMCATIERREPAGSSLWRIHLTDITGRKLLELALEEEVSLKRHFLDESIDGIAILESSTCTVMEANPAFAAMLGYSQGEVIGLRPWDWDTVYSREQILAMAAEQPEGKAVFETRMRRKDGTQVPVEIKVSGFIDGGMELRICAVRDITGRKLAEAALREQETLHAAMIEQAPVGVVLVDIESLRFSDFNDLTCSMLGYDRQEFAHLTLADINVGWNEEQLRKEMAKLEGSGRLVFETVHRTKNGSLRDTQVSACFISVRGKKHALAFWVDVTETVRQREQLHRLAFYDPLTGLPNRALFRERLRQETAEHNQRKEHYALLLLDLDHFKDINDILGHTDGDRMLKEIARRIRGCLREGDTLARLGGDEFGVLLPSIRSSQDAGEVAQAILNQVILPLRISERDVYTSASIGIAIYPDDTRRIKELLACADMAMYHAKSKGRNTFKYHDLRLTDAAETRITLGAQLRHALKRRELELYFQPKVSMTDGRIIGAEALLRWNHPELGLLAPDKFISIAESSGLIVEIGAWVLDQACADMARWNLNRETPVHVAVNLSGRQFHAGGLAELVRKTLSAHGCQGPMLELELTETIVLDDNPNIQSTLEAFSSMGVTVAIDDFGTGHSALSYLNRFRVDVLKIDRSFVMGLEKDRRKAELVKAFIAVARALGMGLVAEGVELPEQSNFLCQNGCTVAQGYLYGRPVPLQQFTGMLDSNYYPCELAPRD